MFREFQFELRVSQPRKARPRRADPDQCPLTLELWSLGQGQGSDLNRVLCYSSNSSSNTLGVESRLDLSKHLRDGVSFSGLWREVLGLCGQARLGVVYRRMRSTDWCPWEVQEVYFGRIYIFIYAMTS
jgi:hypothetical protein